MGYGEWVVRLKKNPHSMTPSYKYRYVKLIIIVIDSLNMSMPSTFAIRQQPEGQISGSLQVTDASPFRRRSISSLLQHSVTQ